MTVNFSEAFIEALWLTGNIGTDGLTDKVLRNVLVEYQKSWPRRSLDKWGRYTANKTQHHINLEVQVLKKSPPNVRFSLHGHTIPTKERIKASTSQKEEKEFADILNILDSLGRLDLRFSAHGDIDWSFPPDTRQTIIRLPLLSTSNPDLPFSDLVGVRFRKVVDTGVVSTILEMHADRSLHVNIRFPFTEPISSSILDNAVAKGARLLSGFVTEPKRGEKSW